MDCEGGVGVVNRDTFWCRACGMGYPSKGHNCVVKVMPGPFHSQASSARFHRAQKPPKIQKKGKHG